MKPALFAAMLLIAVEPVAAIACGPDSLGTARVMKVEGTGGPRYGRKQYAQTLPLADREVVLTFDDGPYHTTTPRVLDALARECVRATFFMIGRNAAELPHVAARVARDGHTVANHTWSHPWTLGRLSHTRALADIDQGEQAIRGAAGTIAPFVRFPGFVETPEILAEMSRRNIAVFGADVWASDWNPQSPEGQLHLILARLARSRGGIVLFHDTKEQTAAMLPSFLRELKRQGYRVVHITG